MKKIVLLPLDERPCNYLYPIQMFNQADIEICVPDKAIMGDKKIPAKFEDLKEFLLSECLTADGLVVSIDTLLYGGIVPSRLHYHTKETLLMRLNLLREIKEKNTALKIYAFNLIMRCPQYSSSDEEPDYYEECGLEIFKTGYIEHRMNLNLASEEEVASLRSLKFDKKYLEDYLNRRKLNTSLNIEVLSLVDEQLIDFLIIPQDDASEYGWTALDQIEIRKVMDAKCLQLDCYMYPGADEAANNLIAKMICHFKEKRPLFYIKYNSITGGQTIPLLEDRYLDTTIKYQILSSGGLITTSVQECDIVLMVNSSATRMNPSSQITANRDRGLSVLRNLPEYIEFMDYAIHILKKDVCIADVATLNGSDYELIKMMQKRNLLLEVASYAGWNTSSNTLGTCIPHSIMTHIYGKTEGHYNFLVSRYLEDFGYMSVVRGKVSETLKEKGMTYFKIDGCRGEISKIIKKELENFVKEYLPSLEGHYRIVDCYQPWNRMFETGLIVKYLK